MKTISMQILYFTLLFGMAKALTANQANAIKKDAKTFFKADLNRLPTVVRLGMETLLAMILAYMQTDCSLPRLRASLRWMREHKESRKCRLGQHHELVGGKRHHFTCSFTLHNSKAEYASKQYKTNLGLSRADYWALASLAAIELALELDQPECDAGEESVPFISIPLPQK